jgi:hypothetical protein
MTEPDIQRTSRRQLARLWQCDTDAVAAWHPEDLAAMLKHLLASRLADVLHEFDPRWSETTRQCEAAYGDQVNTLGELFQIPQPPLDLLHLVKRYSKRAGNDEWLPVDVAAVLYAAAIAAGLVRWGQRITSADDHALRSKLAWAASRAWIDADTRALLEASLQAAKDTAMQPQGVDRV